MINCTLMADSFLVVSCFFYGSESRWGLLVTLRLLQESTGEEPALMESVRLWVVRTT